MCDDKFLKGWATTIISKKRGYIYQAIELYITKNEDENSTPSVVANATIHCFGLIISNIDNIKCKCFLIHIY